MENGKSILEGYGDLEKGAYLGAIASMATADRHATHEEIDHIKELCTAAQLSPEQTEHVVRAATELSGEELTNCLDVLKGSELRFSLIADLSAFAKADDNYSEEEQQKVQQIAEHLGVNQEQFSLLDQFAEKTVTTQKPAEEISSPSFLSSLGLKDQMQKAGINPNGFLKGLLSFAGPMILGGLIGRATGRRRTNTTGGGGLMGGGLGSLIGMLSGGRGFGGTGGLLGKILGRRGF